MQTVILDFNTRAREINEYFSFLEGLDNGTIKFAISDNDGGLEIKSKIGRAHV